MSNVNFTMPIERKSAAIMFTDIAYNQIQDNASAMDDGAIFLSYPIPKAIIEAWEKVNR